MLNLICGSIYFVRSKKIGQKLTIFFRSKYLGLKKTLRVEKTFSGWNFFPWDFFFVVEKNFGWKIFPVKILLVENIFESINFLGQKKFWKIIFRSKIFLNHKNFLVRKRIFGRNFFWFGKKVVVLLGLIWGARTLPHPENYPN